MNLKSHKQLWNLWNFINLVMLFGNRLASSRFKRCKTSFQIVEQTTWPESERTEQTTVLDRDLNQCYRAFCWYSDICAKRHLREATFARSDICANRHLREPTFARTDICANRHLREPTFARTTFAQSEGERKVRLSQDSMPILGEGERD